MSAKTPYSPTALDDAKSTSSTDANVPPSNGGRSGRRGPSDHPDGNNERTDERTNDEYATMVDPTATDTTTYEGIATTTPVPPPPLFLLQLRVP